MSPCLRVCLKCLKNPRPVLPAYGYPQVRDAIEGNPKGIVSSSPGLRPRCFRQPFTINPTQMLTMRHRRIDTPAQKERGRNPYMLSSMISWLPFILRSPLGPTAPSEGCLLRCSTKASVASRSGAAQQAAAAKMAIPPTPPPFHSCPDLVSAFLSTPCFSCAGKKMRLTPLRKGWSAACVSSCNPRTALGQSVAQPEPRTPCAPNSNRCQSASYDCQLVYVRMS